MELEKRVEQILARYQNRFNLLLEEMRSDLLELTGLEEVAVEEVPVGEARRIAILTECVKAEKEYGGFTRQHLSGFAQKFGRKPGTCGVFFRPDVNLLESRFHNNKRFVTEKGLDLVNKFKAKFGDNWIDDNLDVLKDTKLLDSYKIKLSLKRGQNNE